MDKQQTAQQTTPSNTKAAQPQNRVEWKKVKELERHGYVVSISKLDLPRRPRFNYEVQQKSQRDDRLFRHIEVRHEGRGHIKVHRSAGIVAELINAAEDYIEHELQANENEYIDSRIEHEQKQINRDRPKPQMGLKALGRRDGARRAAASTEKI